MLDGAHAETDAKNLVRLFKINNATKIWYLGDDEK